MCLTAENSREVPTNHTHTHKPPALKPLPMDYRIMKHLVELRGGGIILKCHLSTDVFGTVTGLVICHSDITV